MADQLFLEFGDFRLERPYQLGEYALQTVIGELLLDLLENGFWDFGTSLGFVHDGRRVRRLLALVSGGSRHCQYPPILRTGFQSPEILGLAELRAERPSSSLGPHG